MATMTLWTTPSKKKMTSYFIFEFRNCASIYLFAELAQAKLMSETV